MKATHELAVHLTPKELAVMLANATPNDFTNFWMAWESHMKTINMDAIAKSWAGYSNGKRVFKKFLTMIEYHEVTHKDT